MLISKFITSLLLWKAADGFDPFRSLQQTTYEKNGFVVTITGNGNVPKYTFYNEDDPDTKYRVQFSQMYETNNGQKLGQSNIALSSLTWEIEEDESQVNGTAFFFNGSDPRRSRFELLSFRNVLLGNSFKFDVVLNGYEFVGDDSTHLDLDWKMISISGNDENDDPDVEDDDPANDTTTNIGEPTTKNATHICFNNDDVCFSVAETADVLDESGNVTDTVGVTLEYPGKIKFKYERFDGDLVHDPTLSIQEESGGGGGSIFDQIINFFKNLINSFLCLFGLGSNC